MDVVFAVLKLLDYFSDEYDHQLGYSIEVSLSKVPIELNLTVKSVETDVDKPLDL